MSDRIFATFWLCVCAVIVWQMWRLNVPFAYEPVGPKAFPLLLAALMVVCCIFLIARPDRDIHWPPLPVLLKGGTLVGTLLAYAAVFDLLGFAAATSLMVVVVARLFGASWRAGVITGLTTGIAGYLLFDRLLEVSLPLGRIWH